MKKILIVDDSLIIRMNLKQILSREGFLFDEASNGKEAVKKVIEWKPDVVLLDITMPEMDGITALQLIRKQSPDSAVIMCSALGQRKGMVNAIQLGAKDFIVKPYHKEQVISTIDKYL